VTTIKPTLEFFYINALDRMVRRVFVLTKELEKPANAVHCNATNAGLPNAKVQSE
jgi:hypothetical protein